MSKIEQYKCDWCCTVVDGNSNVGWDISCRPGDTHICHSCDTKEVYISRLFKDSCNRLGNVSLQEILSDMLESNNAK